MDPLPVAPSILTGLISAGAFVLLHAFFVLSVTAIARSRLKRLKELARESFPLARFGRLVLLQSDRHLLACQAGALVSAFAAGVCAVGPFLSAFHRFFGGDGSSILLFLAVAVSFAVLGVIGLGLIHVAKGLAFARPNRMLCIVSLPILGFSAIFRPLVAAERATFGRVLTRLGLSTPIEREIAVSAEEINEIIEISSKAGQIDEDEREMIQHVFTFSDTVAREVMTPRKDIVWIEESASLDEVVTLFSRERLSRLLVTGRDLDDVKGVVMAKDLIPLIGKIVSDFSLRKYLRPVFFVPGLKKVDELLQELQREGLHFAVVLDEHGGVDGVVTLEDLVEEIVGEIFDEYDSPAEEADVQRTLTGDLLVDGSTILDDLNAAHGLDLPQGDYDTVAGFVLNLFGRVPDVGEQVTFNGLTFKVEQVEMNRVTTVRILFRGPPEGVELNGTGDTNSPPGPNLAKSAENT